MVDTFHHTNVICYQNIEEKLNRETYYEESTPITATVRSKKKVNNFRKVNLSSSEEIIESHWEKQKRTALLLQTV